MQHAGNQSCCGSCEYHPVQPGTSSSSAQDRGSRCPPRGCTGHIRWQPGKRAAARSAARARPCHAGWRPPLPLNGHATAASGNLLCSLRAAGDWLSLKLYPSLTGGWNEPRGSQLFLRGESRGQRAAPPPLRCEPGSGGRGAVGMAAFIPQLLELQPRLPRISGCGELRL